MLPPLRFSAPGFPAGGEVAERRSARGAFLLVRGVLTDMVLAEVDGDQWCEMGS
jgi:hypothetical protein